MGVAFLKIALYTSRPSGRIAHCAAESTLAPTPIRDEGFVLLRRCGPLPAPDGQRRAARPTTQARPWRRHLPAVTNPTASSLPGAGQRMLESRLARTARTAFSSISMTCVALTTSTAGAGRRMAGQFRRSLSGPPRTRTPQWRAASSAPSISGLGCRSEPIASTAITVSTGVCT